DRRRQHKHAANFLLGDGLHRQLAPQRRTFRDDDPITFANESLYAIVAGRSLGKRPGAGWREISIGSSRDEQGECEQADALDGQGEAWRGTVMQRRLHWTGIVHSGLAHGRPLAQFSSWPNRRSIEESSLLSVAYIMTNGLTFFRIMRPRINCGSRKRT